MYAGKIRIVDAQGEIVADQLSYRTYQDWLAEAVEPDSYLKSPYYKPMGYPKGIFRVGPLARLNIISHCGTERADMELAEFRSLQRGAVSSSFHYHYARLIEIIYCIERIAICSMIRIFWMIMCVHMLNRIGLKVWGCLRHPVVL